MQTIREITEDIVKSEGGYVNDPSDPGGPTKYGVTIHTMRRLNMDLDHDGDVDIQDVKALTIGDAIEVFEKHYFKQAHINVLPQDLQAAVYDMNVNSGKNSIKMLQLTLNLFQAGLVVDSGLGQKTIDAAFRAVTDKGGIVVRDAFSVMRRDYLYSIADNRPASRKYAKRIDGGKGGWIVRAESFMSGNLWLTPEQHRQRVRSWT